MRRPLLIPFLLWSVAAATQESAVSLEECFRRARTYAASVQIQEQEIRAAEGRYYQALGGALPHLSLQGSELIQDTSGASANGDGIGSTFLRRSTPELAVNLKQPLFQGFREFKALSASRADKQKAFFETERTGQLLFLEVAQVFLAIHEREQGLKILKSQIEVMEQRLRELKERVRLGKSRRSEVLTIESQKDLLAAERAQTEGEIAVARETLSFLTGLASSIPLQEPVSPFQTEETLAVYLERRTQRPDLHAAEQNFILSEASLAYERGGYFPKLNLEANYYPYRVGFRDPIDWDLWFTLEIPLFQGGTTRGLVREAKARLQQAKLEKEDSVRKSEREIEEAYYRFQSAQEEVKALEGAVETAKKNYQVHLEEYRRGLVTNLDVLQALKDFYQIQREANRASHRSSLNAYQLKVALGEVP